MKFEIFKVNQNFIKKGLNFIKVTVKLFGKSHTIDSVNCSPYGFFGKPLKNATAVTYGSEFNRVTVGYIQKAIEGLNDGESILFSKTPNGDISSTIICRGDNTIELLGDSDNLIRFSKLKQEISNSDVQINGELEKIQTTLDAVVSAFSALGVTIPPYVKQSVNTDIDSSKHEGLKTN